MDIKEGELVKYDRLTEEIEVNFIEDDDVRDNTPTVGYYAMYEYVNSGFKKAIYWTKEKMLNHADRYSSAFSKEKYSDYIEGKIPQQDMWKYSSYWYKDFDGMAYKTMLRQLISKWGIMSIELQKAYDSDQAVPVVKNDEIVGMEYIDNTNTVEETIVQPTEEPKVEEKKTTKRKTKKDIELDDNEIVLDDFEDEDPLA